MAVAAHVSRVSKEYTPFGYSVMEDLHLKLTDSVAPAEGNEMVAYVDDADIYIEHAALCITAGAADGSNTAAFALNSGNNGGSFGDSKPVIAAVQTSTMLNNAANSLVVANPIVPSRRVLRVTWSAETGTVAVKQMVLRLRIRRKA
jgi:hypothetical protein